MIWLFIRIGKKEDENADNDNLEKVIFYHVIWKVGRKMNNLTLFLSLPIMTFKIEFTCVHVTMVTKREMTGVLLYFKTKHPPL